MGLAGSLSLCLTLRSSWVCLLRLGLRLRVVLVLAVRSTSHGKTRRSSIKSAD